MKKNYADTLAEWAKNQGNTAKARRDRHWVGFLSVKADVEAAIAAGFALKTIWQHMSETGRITYRYETFLQHVRRLKRIDGTVEKFGEMTSEKKESPSKSEGFTFNAVPKKEDLF
jgi:Family of unknown function (DUF5338)